MENYKIYCNLKSELKKKKLLLSDLSQEPNHHREEIISLEIDIEEDLNALNIIFNHLISHSSTQKLEEIK